MPNNQNHFWPPWQSIMSLNIMLSSYFHLGDQDAYLPRETFVSLRSCGCFPGHTVRSRLWSGHTVLVIWSPCRLPSFTPVMEGFTCPGQPTEQTQKTQKTVSTLFYSLDLGHGAGVVMACRLGRPALAWMSLTGRISPGFGWHLGDAGSSYQDKGFFCWLRWNARMSAKYIEHASETAVR